jgi:hypothetical protein
MTDGSAGTLPSILVLQGVAVALPSTRPRNRRNPRYSFSNRSDDIRDIFTWACDLLDLHWTTAPYSVYVSRKADVARMDQFIRPKS